MFSKVKTVYRFMLVGVVMAALGIGCAGPERISEEEQDRLNEAQIATEAAVEKLARLREERTMLEEGISPDEHSSEDADE